MLRKIAGALMALIMAGAVAWGATESQGGTSIAQLATAIVQAITSSSVGTVAQGVSAPQAVPVAPQNGSSFPTAPQSSAPNLSGTGTISAANGFVSISTGTLPGLGIQVSGTFVATLSATCSQDGDGTAPISKSFLIPGSAASTTPSAATVSAPGNYAILPGACDHVHITATSWTSGTITVTWTQTGAPFDQRVSAPIGSPLASAEVGSQNAAAGIVPAVSTATANTSTNGVVAKNAAGNLYDTSAANTSANSGWLVVLNLTALPASNATIAPLDFRPLYAGSASAPSFAEIDAKPGISCTAGCVVVMSSSLATYQPTLTGIIAARAR